MHDWIERGNAAGRTFIVLGLCLIAGLASWYGLTYVDSAPVKLVSMVTLALSGTVAWTAFWGPPR